jgi:hypothetical protein
LPIPLESQRIEASDPLQEDDLATLHNQQADDNITYAAAVPTGPAFQGPLCIAPDAAQRERLLAIPKEIDPKVSELARQIAGDGDKSRQLIRIESTLRSQHAYSLSFNPQGEPLNDFILNNRAAHCQYFASAVVMMARAVGIPARFVSGFYAHERYGSDRMVVRSRDAHAWAECWIDGVGWLTVDATPSGGRPDEIYPDPPAWKRWWEKLSDLPDEIREWVSAHVQLSKLAIFAVIIAMSAGYAFRAILRKRRRPKLAPAEYAPPGEELAALRRRFEKWLITRQIGCPPQLTWRDHLSVASAPADSVLFVKMYNQARFGGEEASVRKAEKLMEQLERNAERAQRK